MKLHYRREPFRLDDLRVTFNHRCDALAKLHSQSLHTERMEAARARADAKRMEIAKCARIVKAFHTENQTLSQMDVWCQREGPGLP